MPKINTHRCLQAKQNKILGWQRNWNFSEEGGNKKNSDSGKPKPRVLVLVLWTLRGDRRISRGGTKCGALMFKSVTGACSRSSFSCFQSELDEGIWNGNESWTDLYFRREKRPYGQIQISCRPLSSKQHTSPCIQNLSRILQKRFLFLESYSAESVWLGHMGLTPLTPWPWS